MHMVRRQRDVPNEVHQAAADAWSKWRQKIATIPPAAETVHQTAGARHDPEAGLTPEERMIRKIKRRMQEYPEWYATDPETVGAAVGAQLERIGEILDRTLPETKDAVEVWEIPLSVFNWLVQSDHGESFVHGALSAWSDAQGFNAANSPDLERAEKERLRAPFFEIAPPMLGAVLEQMLQTDLWISFQQKYVGPELKYLAMRVQRPA